jgi:hypothetical protein
MKIKNEIKRLTTNKQTIANLNKTDLKNVMAGEMPPGWTRWDYSCNCTYTCSMQVCGEAPV